jgi:hypothetical protein
MNFFDVSDDFIIFKTFFSVVRKTSKIFGAPKFEYRFSKKEFVIPCPPLEVDGGSGQCRVNGGRWKWRTEGQVEGGGWKWTVEWKVEGISQMTEENRHLEAVFRCEEHLYKRLRWSVGPSVGPSPTMRDYVEK